MLYRECRHVIKACEVGKAPQSLKEEDMPRNCRSCRSDNGGGGLEEEMRRVRAMLLARERALMGMRTHFPDVFGGMCRSTVESVGGRIEELRREWEKEVDAAFDENQGRLEW